MKASEIRFSKDHQKPYLNSLIQTRGSTIESSKISMSPWHNQLYQSYLKKQSLFDIYHIYELIYLLN